jgi:hypothetical protein
MPQIQSIGILGTAKHKGTLADYANLSKAYPPNNLI